jgi:hemerythrin superfamily protein
VDAIKFLKQQHDEVEDLFEEFENSESDDEKLSLFEQIADDLAIHATIEERWFYPTVRAKQTEEQLEEAYDEHLEVKRLLLDCMSSTDEPGFDGKVAALKGAVLHHVEEEENEMFPEVKKLFEKDALEALGQQLEGEALTLEEKGNARLSVKPEIEPPAANP